MNIVLALHQFPPFGAGGTEALAQWLAEALRARGHGVRIVSAIPHGAKIDGIPLPSHRIVQFLPQAPALGNGAARIHREYDDAAAGDAFGAILDEHTPDVVHFLHLAGLTAAALRATAARHIPAVFTATDFWFECPTVQLLLCDHSGCVGPQPQRLNCARHLMELRYPMLHGLSGFSALDGPAAAVLQLASRVPGLNGITAAFQALATRSQALRAELGTVGAVIAPTAFMRERLKSFGVPDARLHLVPYGVPPPRNGTVPHEQNTGNTLRIVYIGTLAAHKGPHLLIEALAKLRDVPLKLDLYGDIADTDYCRAIQSSAATDERIRLWGRSGDDDTSRVLGAADVLAVPSLWDENAPLVVLQAIAHRCPVLAADAPGLVEAMRIGRDGWTFRRNDADDLAAALRRLAQERGAIGQIRNSPVVTRSVEDLVADLLPLYGSLRTRATAAAAHA